jgi:hypothetical protein
MTTMLEKAALAAIEAMPFAVGSYGPSADGPDATPWIVPYVDCGEVDFTAVIRAALQAIRAEVPITGRVFGPDGSESAQVLWQDMIDAILNEPNSAT